MCQIIINFTHDKDTIKKVFKNQTDRSGDGVGILSLDTGELDKFYSTKSKQNKIIYSEQAFVDRFMDENGEKVILHGRKASVGSKGEDNLHPVEMDNYYLFHNGTLGKADRLKDLLSFFGVETDTQMVAKAIEGLMIYEDWYTRVYKYLSTLSQSYTIGTIIIYSRLYNDILVFSDGARSLAIWTSDMKNIDMIANYYNDESEELRFKGYIHLDDNGKILDYKGHNIRTDFDTVDIDIVYDIMKSSIGVKGIEKLENSFGDDFLYDVSSSLYIDPVEQWKKISEIAHASDISGTYVRKVNNNLLGNYSSGTYVHGYGYNV